MQGSVAPATPVRRRMWCHGSERWRVAVAGLDGEPTASGRAARADLGACGLEGEPNCEPRSDSAAASGERREKRTRTTRRLKEQPNICATSDCIPTPNV